MGNNRNPFDLPVEGYNDREINLAHLKKAFERAAVSDPETALRMGRYLNESRYTSGRIAYCHFLWTAVAVSAPRAERHAEAERILLEIRNDLDISDKMDAQISTELAGLYHAAGRPVGHLAALLRAKRYGSSIPEHDIERARKRLQASDVNRLGDNPQDAFDLAVELEILKADRLTELFYQLATEADNKMLKAKAALHLADYYDRNRHKSQSYAQEAHKYYAMAEACGLPDVLSW